ncbi:hypothetical protein GLOIN_2v1781018 [Rhizophagus irregularis DAOM 181602=DAOM 197198]|uniref:Uncharacterized protein n=1 Tax=Rhizophagus irregularis (strain DAOM 181602 / DAOM 197198 / MUCL 43194) TaxID=747089 RepID=A0A2P4PKV6_RHIID|nr:hypothetical protein GLOIN_2v1781018 [Rhizophagus irregularis DAOM 181602=DAOM 197198]POG66032.1 hypothetical protein GLOIN_2v1781018 [Rhizophagus irregularis DAOM 181602=DAOM 197198]|eukprot:XP_025172898.1 hypothetical protein GLOIN_2v1781018 [Rhizophagus irregularis DAOM 181602=DAOM 197198]
MSAIVSKYVAGHKLNKDMINEELSQHILALLELLTDKLKRNKDEKTTCASNKIQKERRDQCENEGIDFPDHFSLESVKKRLNFYDVSNIPDVQALADDNSWIFRLLERDEERAKLLLTWIQDAISSEQLRDPGVPGVKWFNTFLKKNRFLPETSKPLLPSYLCKLGAVFAVVLNGAKNLSDAMTIASQAFRHSPHNHTSPAQNYTIINF